MSDESGCHCDAESGAAAEHNDLFDVIDSYFLSVLRFVVPFCIGFYFLVNLDLFIEWTWDKMTALGLVYKDRYEITRVDNQTRVSVRGSDLAVLRAQLGLDDNLKPKNGAESIDGSGNKRSISVVTLPDNGRTIWRCAIAATTIALFYVLIFAYCHIRYGLKLGDFALLYDYYFE